MSKYPFTKVDAQFVGDHIGKLPIVDVRPEEMFMQGHIPTAINIPLQNAVNDADGFLDDAAEILVKEAEIQGIKPEDRAIIYCQTGHHATEAAILLAVMGYGNLYVYRGSFSDWVTDPTRPIER